MLKWVHTTGLRGALWGFGLATCLGLFAAWVRLLPWMFASDVPWRVIWPFARVLLASGLELALLVGVPVGWLASWVAAAQRGEVRALIALGSRPGRLLATALPQLFLLGLLVATGARVLSGSVDGSPAQVLTQLVKAGERHCAEHPADVADVPVAGLVQHCPSQRLVGRLPGTRPGWFATSGLQFASSSKLELGASQFLVRGPQSVPWLRLEVEQAQVRGFISPKAAARSLARALGLALAVGCFGLLLLPVLQRAQRVAPMLWALAGGVGAVVALKQLDRLAWPSAAYALLALPPLIASGIALFLSHRRVWRSSQ